MSISRTELKNWLYYEENIELLEKLFKELNQIYKEIYINGNGDSSKEVLFSLDKEIKILFIEDEVPIISESKSQSIPCFKIKLNKKLIYEGKDEYGYSKLDVSKYSLKTIVSEIKDKIISEVSLIVRCS